MKAPEVGQRDWVLVGHRDVRGRLIAAMVCAVRPELPEEIEVVYLDFRGRAISCDVAWNGDRWEFVPDTGTRFVEEYDRLRDFVAAVKAGRSSNTSLAQRSM